MRCFEIDFNQIIKIKLLGKETLVPPRMHRTRYAPEYVMYVLTEGELYLEENGKEIMLSAGDVYIFKKGDFQKPLKSTFCKYYYIHFETESFTEYKLNDKEYYDLVREKKIEFLKLERYDTKCYDYMKALLMQENKLQNSGFFEYLKNILESNLLADCRDVKKRMSISAAFSELLMRLEEVSVERIEKNKQGESAGVYRNVQKIAEYIEKNYKSDIGSREIEQIFFLNFDYVNRIFKRIMGCSIIRYRNRLRIEEAKVRMLISDMTFSEIASEVGFCDSCYFNRVFKKFEGTTPGEYRELMQRKGKENVL